MSCAARTTLMRSTSLQSCLNRPGDLFNMHRDGDRSLQSLIFSEEFLVSATSARADYVPVQLLATACTAPYRNVHDFAGVGRVGFLAALEGIWEVCQGPLKKDCGGAGGGGGAK